ncbi:MAG: hypothetical protein R3E79_11165 [Caldilineaceae bacterium]
MIEIDQVVQRAVELPPFIDERKLDFLLGYIVDGPAAAKSVQRGYDFSQRLGFDRTQLRTLLEQQVTLPDLADRVTDVRKNQFGGPLINVRMQITGFTGIRARLISSWEVTDRHLRLITAWVELDRV